MSRFSVSRKVPYDVEQVFAIARDVARYNEFVPLVTKSRVVNHRELPDGRNSFDAELQYAYKKLGIADKLHSLVVIDPLRHTVTATSSEGPVKSMVSEWRIVAGANGDSEIHFTVDYTLKSRSLQFILSGMFDMAVRHVMNAFEERARKLYGAAAA